MNKLNLDRRRLLLICILFFFIGAVYGINQLQFDHIGLADGLSHGTVNDVFRDNKGFLWICTDDGLDRYDGYDIKTYKESNFEQANRSIGYLCVVESQEGIMWFGTTHGLFYYNPLYDQVFHFERYDPVDSTLIQFNSRVFSLCLDDNDRLWCGTWNGLVSIDLSAHDLTQVAYCDITVFEDSLQNNNYAWDQPIYSISKDSKGGIWYTSNASFLYKYDSKNKRFNRIKAPIEALKYEYNNHMKLLIDGEDNIYINTDGQGIFYWDRTQDTVTELRLKTSSGELLEKYIVRTMYINKSGTLWIGTDGYGLFAISYSGIQQYTHGQLEGADISSNVIYSIYEDDEGNMWFGTYLAGLNKLSKNKTNFGKIVGSEEMDMGLSGRFVFNFLEDHLGYLWIATDGGGLNRMNPKDKTFKHYMPEPNNVHSISTKVTIALFQDSEKNIWIGSYNGGLNRYNYADDNFTRFYHDPQDSFSICSNHPWAFAEDRYGNLWIASNDQGLDLKLKGSERFINYGADTELSREKALSSWGLTSLLVDSRNFLWIGSEAGLDWVDLNKVDFSQPRPDITFQHHYYIDGHQGLSSNAVSFLAEDNNGDIWISTKGGGLNHYMVDIDSFIHYTTADGLPHNTIQGIVFDDQNRVWFSSLNGLSVMDLESKEIENFTKEDGLQDNQFIKTACYKTKDGMLLFGGINGFNRFYPSSIKTNNSPPKVQLTSFKLFNKELTIGEKINDRVILKYAINETEKLTLDYRHNFFTLEFAALDFINPSKNQYAYMMEGFDNDWVYVDAENRKAVYTNLDPGNYIFRVKASNNNGVWNTDGIALNIEVLPPWWARWWFRIGVIVLLISIVLLVFYIRVNQLKSQKNKLAILVDERTQQLQEANSTLKEMNATKDKFFSIIAHDVMSPFNGILGLSDLMYRNRTTLPPEKLAEFANLIHRSTKQLHALLQNLLDWSRSERGVLKFKPTVVDLKPIIDRSIGLNKWLSETKGIAFIVEYQLGDKQAYTDPQLVETALRNLQSNAIKFTPKGGTITIRVVEEGEMIKVSVSDTGVGMDEETKSKVFNPQEVVTTKGTDNEVGTGLGLKLVAEFVQLQGGEVSVESAIGEGCTIHFTVPMHRA